MCGIAGYIGPQVIDPARIGRCLRAMHHRGPDARGWHHHAHRGRHAYLLHTRLSIVDLDPRANQPFRLGSKVMVYNGELYNHPEVARWLDLKPSDRRTNGDTEVMLHAIAARGAAGFEECEGMWALAVYDEADGSLMLSRDRFGEKPLYLLRAGGGLYFGSEIKFLIALSGHSPKANVQHVYRYLVNGYKSLYKNGCGFHQDIASLPPASVMTIDAEGRESVDPCWRPHCEAAPDESMPREQAVESVRVALHRAVGIRLRADVPLAFLLSGGVDSTAITSIARRVFDHDVHGFTIIDDDPRYDEREVVQQTVRELGIRHTAVPTNRDRFLEQLRGLVRQHDAPICTITYYAQWLLLKAVADHGYKISVSGTGADELFSGYYDHHNAYLYEVRDQPELFDASLDAWRRHIQPIVRNPHLSDPRLFIRNPGFRGHIFLDAPAFADMLSTVWSEPFSESRYAPGLLRNRMLNELFHEAVPPILHEDDANAMSCSIENRSPFLDRGLFEACQRIPTRHLIHDGFAKSILRDAVRGIAPDHVVNNRRKIGFNAPVLSFLDAVDPKVREAVLDRSPIFDHVRRDRIEALLDEGELPNSRSKFLFYFLSAKMFMEEVAA